MISSYWRVMVIFLIAFILTFLLRYKEGFRVKDPAITLLGNNQSRSTHGEEDAHFASGVHDNYFATQIVNDLLPWREGIPYSALIDKHRAGSGDLIMIRRNKMTRKRRRLFRENESPGQKKKELRWRKMINSLLQRVEIPDVIFLAQFCSFPIDLASKQPRAPTFSMAKTGRHWDVLFPNPFFYDYFSYRNILLKASMKEWHSRKSKAFFRGECGQDPARATLATMREDILDVGVTRKCKIRRSWSPSKRSRVASLQVHKAVQPSHLADYKYLIVMPGAVKSSYSRSMQFFSTVGAVVLFWKNEHYEFYYHQLRNGTHFLEVDETNILETVKFLRENDGYARSLASRLHQFARSYLTEQEVYGYYQRLFYEYSRIQAFNASHIAE